jgi:spermidine synthase
MSRSSASKGQSDGVLLLASVFVVACCGLVYELIAGALSSYLVGSSVTSFSIVIGLFMFAMGVGSYLSRFVRREALTAFVMVQILTGLAGGYSALFLFLAFAYLGTYTPFLVGTSLVVGTLVGLEIPLMVRVVRERQALARAVSSVLALDYVGALVASLAFPLLLVPHVGLVRSGLLFGVLNVGVAGLALWRMADSIRWLGKLRAAAAGVGVVLAAGFALAGQLTRLAEDSLYQDDIILARDTPYQRLVVTRWHDDIRLYLNGHIQFSSVDEARYHESLVHPAMAAVPSARRVLILGGGDGLAVREVLKYEVERVDLVDLDPVVTGLFRDHAVLADLNEGSLRDPRATIHHADAWEFLEESAGLWDVILVDLPDPSGPSLARLYSTSFYRLVARHLTPGGVFATQATSPFYAPEAFWCIVTTIEEAGPGFVARPYHANVPSFGEWGFVLAARRPVEPAALAIRVPTRFLTEDLMPALFLFPGDLQRRAVESNRLDRPVLVRYYETGWKQHNE